MKRIGLTVLPAAVLLAGCVHDTVPGLPALKPTAAERQANPGAYDKSPSVNDVLNHISCEIRRAFDAHQAALARTDYLIGVNVLFEVEDTFSLTPSVAYTEPLKLADTKLVTSLSGDITRQRRRNFTSDYTLSARGLTEKASLPPGLPALTDDACGKVNAPPNGALDERPYVLTGDLRIGEIVRQGLEAGDLAGVVKDGENEPSFGSVVEFIVTSEIGGGPAWTLKYWSLPSGSDGLAKAKNIHTNKVTLSFTPTKSGKPNALDERGEAEADAAAAQRLRNMQTNLLLQNLTPKR